MNKSKRDKRTNMKTVEVIPAKTLELIEYSGFPPQVVPIIRKDGGILPSGKQYFPMRLEALSSRNPDKIENIADREVYLSDACITLGDRIKIQLKSPFLTGLEGYVKTNDGLFVAIDARAVEKGVVRGGMKHFKVSQREVLDVSSKVYDEDGYLIPQENREVTNVVLLPARYGIGLTHEQYNVIKGKEIMEKDIPMPDHFILHIQDNPPVKVYVGDYLKKSSIVKHGKVIHPVWALYPADIVIPLVEETFRYIDRMKDQEYVRREDGKVKAMGFTIRDYESREKDPILNWMYVDRFWMGSVLRAEYVMHAGPPDITSLVTKHTEGIALEVSNAYANMVRDAAQGADVLHAPGGRDYVAVPPGMQVTECREVSKCRMKKHA